MTDKEIIIDGADISKCRLFKGMNKYHKEQARCGFYAFCNGTYCDYKKLACKTAECEKYEQALDEIKEYTRKQFCDNCEDIGSTEYNCHCEYCEYQEYFDIINRAKGKSNG